MNNVYKTKGTCCAAIDISMSHDGVIQDVTFFGGCNGNTKAIGALVKGLHANDVIARLDGIKCGNNNTSCPDQLAKALKEMMGDVKTVE